MTSIVKWIGVALIVAVGGWKFVEWVNTPTQGSKDTVVISDSDWQVGPSEAKVTVVEYSDFQCPACAVYHPIVEQLKNTYSDRVRFVFRHYPLTTIHNNAYLAALAAEAAGKQGKFWEMSDKLFGGQADWSESTNPKDKFFAYASEIGVNIDDFTKDLDAKVGDAKVKADIASGDDLLLNSTPSFYVNNVKVENPQGYDAFKSLLDSALQ